MRQRGYTLMEVVVTLAVFGIFLTIIVTLTLEMRKNEQRYPINYMANPQVGGVVVRLRKDIFDTMYYPDAFQGYSQTRKTLLLYTLKQTGFAETVIWDFRNPGEVHRKAFNATQQVSDWVAHGVPDFEIAAFTLSTGQDAVRITAKDDQQKLAIDQIILPRAHK